MHNKSLDLIGASLGWGAQRPETELGPQAFKDFGVLQALQSKSEKAQWRGLLAPEISYSTGQKLAYADCLKQIEILTHHLAIQVQDSYQAGHLPIVVGGDHTIAIGTWSGLITSLRAQKQFGLIWVDAHMDAHTPQTTPSHAIHGMPLAVLLGYGEPSLINLCAPGPKLDPRHVVLIGVRSFEEKEAQLLKRLNVKVFYMDEVKKRGFQAVFAQAVEIVSHQTQGFGVSVDLDAFDPKVAPGVGSPAPDGLYTPEVYRAFAKLSAHKKFMALEIAELNPQRDIDNKTLQLAQDLILSIL